MKTMTIMKTGKTRTFLRRVTAMLSVLALSLSMCTTAMAGTYNLVNGVGKLSANTSSSHKYSKYWQYWSQGASGDANCRSVGCHTVAQAKLLVETGAASSNVNSFNPDVFMNWQKANGYLDKRFLEQGSNGDGAIKYAAQHGVTLRRAGSVSLTGNNRKDAATVMDKINQGYYVILYTSKHEAYIGRQASLAAGTPIILDSWSSWSYNAAAVQTLKDYTLVSFSKLYYFQVGSGSSSSSGGYGDIYNGSAPSGAKWDRTATVVNTNGAYLAINIGPVSAKNGGTQIGRIPPNGQVKVCTAKTSGNWYYVSYNGVEGYAYSKYLKLK